MERDKAAIPAGCQVAGSFYASRDPARAQTYATRAREYAEWVARVKAETSTMRADADLAPARLSAQDLEAVAAILREHGQKVRGAYVARRVIKSDPAVLQHVLAIETGPLTYSETEAQAIVKRLAQQPFPGTFFVVHLGTRPFKRLREPIRRLGIQPLPFR